MKAIDFPESNMKKSMTKKLMTRKLLDKLKSREETTFSTKEIFDMVQRGELNLNPPYQREQVWPEDYKSDLITSIFGRWPIPTLTLVEAENKVGYIVLDGKQRITTIRDFYQNLFSATHQDWEDGVARTYVEMCLCANTQVRFAGTQFESTKIRAVILPWMSWQEQRDIFRVLNHSVQLGTNEKIFCENFHVKRLLSYLWKESGLDTYKCLSPSFRTRFNHLRFIHNILFKVFEREWDNAVDVWQIQGLYPQKI